MGVKKNYLIISCDCEIQKDNSIAKNIKKYFDVFHQHDIPVTWLMRPQRGDGKISPITIMVYKKLGYLRKIHESFHEIGLHVHYKINDNHKLEKRQRSYFFLKCFNEVKEFGFILKSFRAGVYSYLPYDTKNLEDAGFVADSSALPGIMGWEGGFPCVWCSAPKFPYFLSYSNHMKEGIGTDKSKVVELPLITIPEKNFIGYFDYNHKPTTFVEAIQSLLNAGRKPVFISLGFHDTSKCWRNVDTILNKIEDSIGNLKPVTMAEAAGCWKNT